MPLCVHSQSQKRWCRPPHTLTRRPGSAWTWRRPWPSWGTSQCIQKGCPPGRVWFCIAVCVKCLNLQSMSPAIRARAETIHSCRTAWNSKAKPTLQIQTRLQHSDQNCLDRLAFALNGSSPLNGKTDLLGTNGTGLHWVTLNWMRLRLMKHMSRNYFASGYPQL